jgi:lysophospholipase
MIIRRPHDVCDGFSRIERKELRTQNSELRTQNKMQTRTDTEVGQIRSTENFICGGAGKLFYRSVAPAGTAWGRLGLLHGYGDHCSRYLHFFRWMAERGVACHAIDFRGHGRSDGKRGFVARWDEFLDDANALREEAGMKSGEGPPTFLVGHSHGGLVLVMAALRGLNGVAGTIFSCPYFKSGVPVPWYKMMLGRVANRCMPSIAIRSGLRPEWLCRDEELVEDSRNDPYGHLVAKPRWFLTMQEAQAEVMERAGEFKLPMLMLVGKGDCIAVPEVAERFFERAGSENKKILVYPQMLHEVLREKEREEVFGEILRWMKSRI